MATLLPAIPAGALLYQRAVTNQIGATAASANSLGYLGTNKTQLEVVGELTGQNNSHFYNFTFQNKGGVRLSVVNIEGTAPARVRVYDGTGTFLIADSQGNAKQKKAYNEFISKDGHDLKPGTYALQVTYGAGANKSKKHDYAIQIGAGTTFKDDFRTLARSSTIQNTLLGGGKLGYTPLGATASAIANLSVGNQPDIFGALSLFNVDIFA